jgi:hypothetical protein
MEANVETHALFFKIMTPKKLNELLLRASGNNSILQRDINDKLKSLNIGFAQVRLVEELEKENGDEICSIYINFINQNGKFGHITFHFDTKRSIYKKNIVGRFHAKNNRNNTRKYAFRINTNSNKSYITMSLSKFSANPVPDLKQCIDVSLEVLNLYFNPDSNLYLGIHNPNVPLSDHPCLTRITKVLKRSTGSLQKTRKLSTTGRYVLLKHNSVSSQTNRKSPWGKVSVKDDI